MAEPKAKTVKGKSTQCSLEFLAGPIQGQSSMGMQQVLCALIPNILFTPPATPGRRLPGAPHCAVRGDCAGTGCHAARAVCSSSGRPAGRGSPLSAAHRSCGGLRRRCQQHWHVVGRAADLQLPCLVWRVGMLSRNLLRPQLYPFFPVSRSSVCSLFSRLVAPATLTALLHFPRS